MTGPAFEPSLNEWVLLALLAEADAHGFALSRELEPHTDLGRILTVRRPLVYRALARLTEHGMCVATKPEPGDSGPKRVRHRITPNGRRAVGNWLEQPVAHIRDLRIEFLVKLRLTERAAGDRSALVEAQKASLASTVESLAQQNAAREDQPDVVDRWRHHNAVAAAEFLEELLRT